MIRAALAALLFVSGAAAAQTPQAEPVVLDVDGKPARTVPLRIQSAKSNASFSVEIAATPSEQERGLMFRWSMPEDHGMIFPMKPARETAFWMKNTYIPLDIVFIGPDHKIIRVAENATPRSLDLIECTKPTAAVLELNGGVARKRGIAAGDTVTW